MTTMRYPVSIERAPLEGRVEIVGPATVLAEVLRSAGLPVPDLRSSAASRGDTLRVLWIGPRRMVVASPLAERARVVAALGAAMPAGAAVVAADVTGSTVTFILEGSGVLDVLSQGFAHDLARLFDQPGHIIATDGWGTAAVLERWNGRTHLTVDATLGDYVEHMLRSAAGLPLSTRPGVMQSPPSPIRVSG